QVGLMLPGFVDTLMVGRVSPRALAAVALANLYFFNVIVGAQGTLMALDPLVSQAVGARDEPALRDAVQRGAVLAVALAAVTALLLMPAEPLFRLVHQPPEVIGEAARVTRISAWGTLPYLVFVHLRQCLQAMHRVRAIVVAIIAANLANVALNWVLIFGHLGVPPMGAVGSGWATVISRWLMAAFILALSFPAMRPYLALRRSASTWAAQWQLLRIGIPIGIQQGLEAAAFGTIGILMGGLGMLEMASHEIALSLASMTFMVPLGVGAAAAVRVGHAVGAGDASGVRRAAVSALVTGVGFMTLTAAAFLTIPRLLAGMYTDHPAVIGLAASLIPIAGVFQVFDGIQAVGSGILRGIGDTRVALLVYLAGFWCVGVPVSAWLAFGAGYRATGLWWGFVAGLGAVAVFVMIRVRVRLSRTIHRI
ncbi:MAG TPA: MATE family efflux transporter, partial [Gemmatimonadaceae bacterium]